MTLEQLTFYLMAGLAVVGGAGLAVTRNVVHGALFLILALLAVGGLFFLLLADFLAIVQVLLYAGGITILLLFAMMLTQARERPVTLDTPQKPFAALAALGFFVATGLMIYATPWPRQMPEGPRHVNFVDLAGSLFSRWAVAFELASILLLVALIGAIIIARTEEHP